MHGEVSIQQLEYLLALARERHFGRAASACHVSQPTLSVAIRRLEHELDVVIVLRGQRFEGFTAEGQRVVTWAHRILAERNELLADIERMRGGLTVTARIGAVPTSVPASPLVTGKFLHRYPGATVQVESLSSREIARRLGEFELDAGLTYLDLETPPGTRSVELYRERLRTGRALDAPGDAAGRSALVGSGTASAVRADHDDAQSPHHRRQHGRRRSSVPARGGGRHRRRDLHPPQDPAIGKRGRPYLVAGVRDARRAGDATDGRA